LKNLQKGPCEVKEKQYGLEMNENEVELVPPLEQKKPRRTRKRFIATKQGEGEREKETLIPMAKRWLLYDPRSGA
jgi:hypothetical protein